jgi:hypothetical protein
VPVEGGEKRRRPSSVRSRAEEVAGGTRRCATRWRRPKEAVVRRPEEGETLGGPVLGRKDAVAWADFGKFQRKSRWTTKAIGLN